MASKRNTPIEVPGESSPETESTPPAADGLTAASSDEGAASATAAPADEVANPDPVTDGEKKRELDRQLRVTAKLVGSSEALDWSHLTNPAGLQAKINTYVDPDKDLPHPDEIDWAKHPSGKVLTKQGWLLRS